MMMRVKSKKELDKLFREKESTCGFAESMYKECGKVIKVNILQKRAYWDYKSVKETSDIFKTKWLWREEWLEPVCGFHMKEIDV